MRTRKTPKIIISHRMRWVYIRIPKTASSSIKQHIYNQDRSARYLTSYIDVKRALIYARKNNYFIFTVVRDDFDRMVSAWQRICFSIIPNPDGKMVFDEFKKKHIWLEKKMPFRDFAIRAMDHDDEHWRPCRKFLIPGVHVIKYEESDFQIPEWVNRTAEYTDPSKTYFIQTKDPILKRQIKAWAAGGKKGGLNLGILSFWFERIRGRYAMISSTAVLYLVFLEKGWQSWYSWVALGVFIFSIIDIKYILPQEREYGITRAKTIRSILKNVQNNNNVPSQS